MDFAYAGISIHLFFGVFFQISSNFLVNNFPLIAIENYLTLK